MILNALLWIIGLAAFVFVVLVCGNYKFEKE